MLRTFRSKALAELWSHGSTRKIDQKMNGRILRRLDALDAATRPEDMDVSGFDFHALRGFEPKRYTVHVNGPWCVTYSFEGVDAVAVDFEQYH